jgi:hypothetical protein
VEVLEDRWVPSAPIGVNNPLDAPVAGGTGLHQAVVKTVTKGAAHAPVSTVSSTPPPSALSGGDPMIVVNNPTDTPVLGQTDLRQAIVQANTNGGDETIVFDSTVFGTPQTITLTGGQLRLSDTTGTETIMGPAAGLTVNGGPTSGSGA